MATTACAPQNAYTGKKGLCDKNSNYGTPRKVLFTTLDYVPSEDDFLLEATFNTGIKGSKVIPLDIQSLSWEDKEEGIHEFETGEELQVKDRTYICNIGVNVSQCLKQQLIKLKTFVGGMMIVYDKKWIQACTYNAGEVTGMRIEKIIVKGEMQKSTSDTAPRMLNLRVSFKVADDFNENEHSRQMTWDTPDLDGLSPTTFVEQGTSSATTIVFDAYINCGGKYKPIEGLADDDVQYSGGPITIVESTTVPGRYTATGVGLTSGTLDVVSPLTSTYTTLFLVSDGGVAIAIA